MNTSPDIVQALLTQDLGLVRQCLAHPGFDIAAAIPSPSGVRASSRLLTWLEIAIIAPAHAPPGLDAKSSIKARSHSRCERIKVIQALLDAGADPNVRGNRETLSPLFLAVCDLGARAPDAVEILLKAGANPREQTALKRTALHMAVSPNRSVDDPGLRSASLLLAHGADPNATDDMQQTPLHWAIGDEYNHEVLMLLHDHGARWDIPDNRSKTPMDKLRSQHPKHADWWRAYPGFSKLDREVDPSTGQGTGPSPRL